MRPIYINARGLIEAGKRHEQVAGEFEQAITLATVLLARIIITIILIVAKNLPGVLEF